MLSQNQVVKVRKAIELTYKGVCTVIIKESYQKPNKSTGFRDVNLYDSIACKLSFTSSPTSTNGIVSSMVQVIKLFVAPEFRIPEGSRIMVTQNEATGTYERSGKSALYGTHQEINLDFIDGQV